MSMYDSLSRAIDRDLAQKGPPRSEELERAYVLFEKELGDPPDSGDVKFDRHLALRRVLEDFISQRYPRWNRKRATPRRLQQDFQEKP